MIFSFIPSWLFCLSTITVIIVPKSIVLWHFVYIFVKSDMKMYIFTIVRVYVWLIVNIFILQIIVYIYTSNYISSWCFCNVYIRCLVICVFKNFGGIFLVFLLSCMTKKFKFCDHIIYKIPLLIVEVKKIIKVGL